MGTDRSVDDLAADGFELVTQWVLRGDMIKPATLDWEDASGWIYAFISEDGSVKYIGLTDNVLRSRLDHYSYGPQSTNKRVRQSIAFELRRGKTVRIFGRKEPNNVRLQAEERRLISAFRPPWNRL